MPEFQIELKNMKQVAIGACIVIPLMLVPFALMQMRRGELEEKGVEEIKHWIALEYIRAAQNDMSMEEQAENIDRLLIYDKVEITDLRVRGKTDDTVVRVEFLIDGQAPPDGKNVRYLRMEHSMVSGWKVYRETSSISFYLKLF